MSEHPELRDGEVATAEAKLDHLNIQVVAMRAVLLQLLQEVARTEKHTDNGQVSQLLDANERLVLSGLDLQAEVNSTAGALDEVTRSVALDSLTQLPNRTVLLDRLEQAIAGARRHRKRVAVLFLDLNNFKQVNDRFGHAAGDEVLQRVAACLTSLVRETDTVSRHGGDEFLMVLAEVSEAADAGILAGKVNAALRVASRANADLAPVTASIGISIYPDDGEDGAALIARADAAMYQAKHYPSGGFAFHARPAVSLPATVPPVVPAVVPTRRTHPQDPVIAEHERRHAQLVEANEQLVLAALGFEALKGAAAGARQLRANLLDTVAQQLGDPQAPIRIAASLSGHGDAHEAMLPRAVGIVERQMAHMARTVGALLEPVQGDLPKLQVQLAIDVTALARAAVDNCRAAIESRHQMLDVHIQSQPIGVRGDAVQLTQVLTQVLRHASDFTPEGGRLKLHIAPAGQSVQLLFSDDGMGIEPEALVSVGPHGGSVAASSAGSGRGSLFTILLPMVELDTST